MEETDRAIGELTRAVKKLTEVVENLRQEMSRLHFITHYHSYSNTPAWPGQWGAGMGSGQ